MMLWFPWATRKESCKRTFLAWSFLNSKQVLFCTHPYPLPYSNGKSFLYPEKRREFMQSKECSAVYDCILPGQKYIAGENGHIGCLTKREWFYASLWSMKVELCKMI